MWNLNLPSWPQTLLNPSDDLMSWWVALFGCGAKGSVQDPQQLPGSLYQHIAVWCLLPPATLKSDLPTCAWVSVRRLSVLGLVLWSCEPSSAGSTRMIVKSSSLLCDKICIKFTTLGTGEMALSTGLAVQAQGSESGCLGFPRKRGCCSTGL